MNIMDMAPDFELPDLGGRLHRLGDYRGRIAVINFWSSDCPHSARSDELLTTWTEGWGGRVALLPVASNATETWEAIAMAARQRRLPQVLIDAQHVVADLYEAQTTPHVFVLDHEGRLRYRGAVDDTYLGRLAATRFPVQEAVQALLAGETPPVPETNPFGCAIIREALE